MQASCLECFLFDPFHFPQVVVLYAVFFYLRYAVSYRNLEDIMAARSAQVDHATLNSWLVKYSPDIAKTAQVTKQPETDS